MLGGGVQMGTVTEFCAFFCVFVFVSRSVAFPAWCYQLCACSCVFVVVVSTVLWCILYGCLCCLPMRLADCDVCLLLACVCAGGVPGIGKTQLGYDTLPISLLLVHRLTHLGHGLVFCVYVCLSVGSLAVCSSRSTCSYRRRLAGPRDELFI